MDQQVSQWFVSMLNKHKADKNYPKNFIKNYFLY